MRGMKVHSKKELRPLCASVLKNNLPFFVPLCYNTVTQKKAPENLAASGAQDGGYLLSHLRSTIGVTKLNFSVRNGKRWNLRAIAT